MIKFKDFELRFLDQKDIVERATHMSNWTKFCMYLQETDIQGLADYLVSERITLNRDHIIQRLVSRICTNTHYPEPEELQKPELITETIMRNLYAIQKAYTLLPKELRDIFLQDVYIVEKGGPNRLNVMAFLTAKLKKLYKIQLTRVVRNEVPKLFSDTEWFGKGCEWVSTGDIFFSSMTPLISICLNPANDVNKNRRCLCAEKYCPKIGGNVESNKTNIT